MESVYTFNKLPHVLFFFKLPRTRIHNEENQLTGTPRNNNIMTARGYAFNIETQAQHEFLTPAGKASWSFSTSPRLDQVFGLNTEPGRAGSA